MLSIIHREIFILKMWSTFSSKVTIFDDFLPPSLIIDLLSDHLFSLFLTLSFIQLVWWHKRIYIHTWYDDIHKHHIDCLHSKISFIQFIYNINIIYYTFSFDFSFCIEWWKFENYSSRKGSINIWIYLSQSHF